jgi:hypothetical protein
LAIQGIAWVIRKAIGLATPKLHIKQYTSPAPDSDLPPSVTHPGVSEKIPGIGKDGLEHIDVATKVAGVNGTTEIRILDGQPRENEDDVFGGYTGAAQWVKIEDLDIEWTKEGWLDEMKEGKGVIRDLVKGRGKDWEVNMVWGFAEINGQRMYVRRCVAKNPEKTANVRLAYDYAGPE